jgi:hypothetical protein
MTTPNINMDFESQPVGPLLHEDQKYPIEGITTVGPVTSITQDDEEGHSPSEEELATLRMVPASMPWPAIAMCLIEFAERASYYGCSGVSQGLGGRWKRLLTTFFARYSQISLEASFLSEVQGPVLCECDAVGYHLTWYTILIA